MSSVGPRARILLSMNIHLFEIVNFEQYFVILRTTSEETFGDGLLQHSIMLDLVIYSHVCRFVGVIVDSHLTYDCHISKIAASCMSKLCQINRVKACFDRVTLTLIIVSLVVSKLLYCSTVWANTSASNIKKLQAVQNYACRIITNTRKFDHITLALHDLKWLPIDLQL